MQENRERYRVGYNGARLIIPPVVVIWGVLVGAYGVSLIARRFEGVRLPNILQETRTASGGAAATVSYVYGLGLIAVTDSVGNTSYVLSDGLGSTSQLASTTGAVTDSYTYDVFGAPRTVTGTTANDFRFTGQQDDVNANRGLYYLRARHYDPALGRFLQRDPIGGGTNTYSYGWNDPIDQVDPSGLCPPGIAELLCGIASAFTHPTTVNPSRNTKFLFDFITGSGPRERYYGQDTPETASLRASPGAAFIREAFVADGCVDQDEIRYGTSRAANDTLLNPRTADPFGTGAQVGAFIASVHGTSSGSILVTVKNDASAQSFFYHLPFVKNRDSGPFSTIHQTFQWKEGKPFGCG